MSRKLIVAIAAVAALGMSSLIATDASARGGGGGGRGGGGGHISGGHVGGGGFSRASFHGRTTATRHVTRTTRTTHVTRNKHVGRPNTKRPDRHHIHFARYHHHHWWWCRHHPYRCGGPWIDVGVDGGVDPVVVADAPAVVAATPAAAVCTNDCDYFLKEEPGCYMAKRAFSTPDGDELRCVKICGEPDSTHAEK